jgi:hypothetical protein
MVTLIYCIYVYISLSVVFVCRKLQDDFVSYKASVDKMATGEGAVGLGEGGFAGAGGTSDVCQACHKTKLAEGSGQECSQCQLRTCSRCGSRTAVKAGKVGDDYMLIKHAFYFLHIR